MVPAARASSSSKSVHSSGPATNASSRCLLLSLRSLFATPYQSSNATTEDNRMTSSLATARRNRRRTSLGVPLISATHAFVSSRYVVTEDFPLRRWRLPAALRHEGLRCEPVKLREPRRHVRDHRLHQDAVSGPANPDSITVESEFTGKANGLTSAVSKEFGCRHERLRWYIPLVYTSRHATSCRTARTARDRCD
jgi:hypothetical protein